MPVCRTSAYRHKNALVLGDQRKHVDNNHWRVLESPVCVLLQASHSNRLHTTTAVFIMFEEVICPLPEHGVGGPHGTHTNLKHQAYSLTLQQDGLHSLEHLLVIFNSKCQDCAIQNQTFSCSRKVCVELLFRLVH